MSPKKSHSTILALKTNRPKYKCLVDKCSKEFSSNRSLLLHFRQIHVGTSEKYGCSFCEAKFTTKFNRHVHIEANHNLREAYKCEECPSRFASARSLWQHRTVHNEERPHKCHLCAKQYKKKPSLKSHIETVHLSMKKFKCSICQKRYFFKSGLKRHAKNHSQDGGKFGCYFCKSRFTQITALDCHLRTHTQEKPFFCSEASCKYSSTNSSNLRRHTRLNHTPAGERPQSQVWSCYFCSKTLRSVRSLVNHSRSHTLEKPFRCGLCLKPFNTQDHLKCHIYSHTKEKPYKCGECQKRFYSNFAVQHHIRAVHRKEKHFSCEFCNYSTYYKGPFEKHVQRHKDNVSIKS